MNGPGSGGFPTAKVRSTERARTVGKPSLLESTASLPCAPPPRDFDPCFVSARQIIDCYQRAVVAFDRSGITAVGLEIRAGAQHDNVLRAPGPAVVATEARANADGLIADTVGAQQPAVA